MNGIFISYRREDAGGFARGIYDHLRQHFDPRYIFRDIDSIKGGEDFVEKIESAVGSCAAVLVVIGRRWADIKDETGQRRLDQPQDFVRLEVAAALRRNIPVIPILLQDSKMPPPSALPDDIEALTRRHALQVSDDRWEFDLARLVERLDDIPALQEIRKPAAPDDAPAGARHRPGRRSFLTAVTVLAVAAAGTVGWLTLQGEPRVRLKIDGVDVVHDFLPSAVQVRAIVNREEYNYPSIDGVEWLQVGPEMTPQRFSLPFTRDVYTVRFQMTLRHENEFFTLVSQDTEEIAFGSLPVSHRYALFNKDRAGTRGATPVAWVRYTITSTP